MNIIEETILRLTEEAISDQSLPRIMNIMFLADAEYFLESREVYPNVYWTWIGRSPFSPQVYKAFEALLQRGELHSIDPAGQAAVRESPSTEERYRTEVDQGSRMTSRALDIARKHSELSPADLAHVVYVVGRTLDDRFYHREDGLGGREVNESHLHQRMAGFRQRAPAPNVESWGDSAESKQEDETILDEFAQLRDEAMKVDQS